jgi:HlyD family secretion protein
MKSSMAITLARALVSCGLALFCFSCADRSAGPEIPFAQVKKQRFSRIIEAQGLLRPLRSTNITLPADVFGVFRIATLAPDGMIVKKGDILARFDDKELKQTLANEESQRQIFSAEKSKEALSLQTEHQGRQREIQSAQRELMFQRTFQPRDPEIFSRDKLIEGETNERLQASIVEIAEQSAQVGRSLDRSRIGLSDVSTQRAEEAIRRARKGLQALELRAPHDGVFTLERDWRGENLRVGTSLWRGQPVGKVALVETMEAEVFVLSAEAAGLTEGLKAEVVLEAQSTRSFEAVIKRVDKVAKTRRAGSPTQYFGVTLSLAKTIPEVMKPEQRVRARLFLYDQEALVLPRPALFDRDSRSVVFVRDARSVRRCPGQNWAVHRRSADRRIGCA